MQQLMIVDLKEEITNLCWSLALFWYISMQEEDAKKLVRDAIAGGIFNDLGSGTNVDLCVIRKGSVDYLRPYDEANVKGVRYVQHLLCLMWLTFEIAPILFGSLGITELV